MMREHSSPATWIVAIGFTFILLYGFVLPAIEQVLAARLGQ